jgi:hypothetical protein
VNEWVKLEVELAQQKAPGLERLMVLRKALKTGMRMELLMEVVRV